jgi:hypothetical protein
MPHDRGYVSDASRSKAGVEVWVMLVLVLVRSWKLVVGSGFLLVLVVSC